MVNPLSADQCNGLCSGNRDLGTWVPNMTCPVHGIAARSSKTSNGPRPTMAGLPALDVNTERTKSEWAEHFFRVTDFYVRLTKWQDAEIERLTSELIDATALAQGYRNELDDIPAPETSRDAEDAAKWRALRNSARITAMGAAGLEGEGFARPDAHVTLNFWTHNEGGDAHDALGRAWLDKYVSKALRFAPKAPARPYYWPPEDDPTGVGLPRRSEKGKPDLSFVRSVAETLGYTIVPTAKAREPLPPDALAGALQERVHEDTGAVRAGRSVKISPPKVREIADNDGDDAPTLAVPTHCINFKCEPPFNRIVAKDGLMVCEQCGSSYGAASPRER